MSTPAFKVFDGHDKLYKAWLQDHPAAYVLNRRRGNSDNYLVLHRASCGKIGNYTQMARPGGFTERSYIKICSDSLDALHVYARGKGGRPDGSFSSKCRLCSP
jgi:hypothetical protein